MLEQVSKGPRKELVAAAGVLYKSGAEPSPLEPRVPKTRAELRQLGRALGHHGSKSAKKNPERHARRLQRANAQVWQAVMVDEALAAAKDRAEHPLRSRLRLK